MPRNLQFLCQNLQVVFDVDLGLGLLAPVVSDRKAQARRVFSACAPLRVGLDQDGAVPAWRLGDYAVDVLEVRRQGRTREPPTASDARLLRRTHRRIPDAKRPALPAPLRELRSSPAEVDGFALRRSQVISGIGAD